MTEVRNINYPPKEILKEKRKAEYLILWMLNNNDYCVWNDFNIEPLNIKQSTLSNNLNTLQGNGLIEKIIKLISNRRKKIYVITENGIKRYNSLSIDVEKGEKRLSYPPQIIQNNRNYKHIIIWLLYNNEYCKWNEFTTEPLNLNQSTLSKKLNLLINQNFIKKERILEFNYDVYKITAEGKTEYSKVLKSYDLDRQSILNEEIKRIEEITSKTFSFFKENKIKSDEIKFRFLYNILKLDYSLVQTFLPKEDDFRKLILFISINNPSEYPSYISIKDFSIKYGIDSLTLDFFLKKIIDENIFSVKFFKLIVETDQIYYFQANGELEKKLRVIVETAITKLAYLNKFYNASNPEEIRLTKKNIEDQILGDICENLFDKELFDSLRIFLWKYIEFLKYKIEQKQALIDISDRLEGIAWHSISKLYQDHKIISDLQEEELSYNIEILENPREDVYETIAYYTKLGILRANKFKNEFFKQENLPLLTKIEKLINQRDYLSGKGFIEENEESFDNVEALILKIIIFSYLKKFDLALNLAQVLLNLTPKKYLGYLLLSKVYEDMRNYEDALNTVEKGLSIEQNTLLICLKTQILVNLKQFKEANTVIDKELSKNPENIPQLLSKSLILRNEKKFDNSLEILNKAIDIMPDGHPELHELLIQKGITLNSNNKYIEAIGIFTKAAEIKSSTINYGWLYSNMALSYMNLKQIEKAEEAIDRGIKLDPHHIHSILTKAGILIYRKDNQNALNLIETAIKIDDGNPVIIRYKAEILFFLEKVEESLILIEESINLDKKNVRSYNTKAKILTKLKRFEEAISTISYALDIDSDYSTLYITKALIFVEKEDVNEALDVIEFAIKRLPKFGDLYMEKVTYLIKLNKLEEALATVNKGLEIDPNFITLYIGKSNLLADMKSYDKAIETIDKGLEINRNMVLLYYQKAKLLNFLKKYKDSLKTINKGLKVQPNFIQLNVEKAYVLSKMNRSDEALKTIETAIELEPKNPIIYLKIVIILASLNQKDKVNELIEKTLKTYPRNVDILEFKARTLLEDGKYKEALEVIDSGLEIEQTNILLYVTKAEILKADSKLEESLAVLSEGSQFDPANIGILLTQIIIYSELGEFETALDTINKAIEIKPFEIILYEIKMDIYHGMEDYEKQLEILEFLIKKDPNNVQNYNYKAYSLCYLGKKEEAIKSIQRAIKLEPNNGDFYDSYGEILIEFHDYEEAIEKLTKALEINPKGSYAHETYVKLGICYFNLKDYDNALKNLNHGRSLSSETNKQKWIEKANKYLSELENLKS